MKLNFDNYPLNVYEKPASKLLLKSIDQESPKSPNKRSFIGQIILGSYVNRFAGAGLLSLIDSISIGIKGEKARKCLSDLIQTQTTRVKQSPKTLLQEAQINLMASACVIYQYESDKYNPSFMAEFKDKPHCWALIKDFNGEIEPYYDPDGELHFIGIGNRSFFTA